MGLSSIDAAAFPADDFGCKRPHVTAVTVMGNVMLLFVRFEPFHILLNRIPLVSRDDPGMAVLHVVLGDLAFVSDLLLCEKVSRVCFLQEAVTHILFVLQDGVNGRFKPLWFTACSRNAFFITFKQIVATEQKFFNYRVNALFWKDMVTNSAANLDWLINNGVLFSGVIDNYYGLGKFDAFHWFQDGKGSNFIGPMAAKAEELGATFMTDTRGRELIMEGGKVAGILATKGDTVVRINCPVVILASGGYANNEKMMKERGYDLTYSFNNGVPGHNGDGLKMAIQAGALDVSRQRGFLREPYSYGINFFDSMTQSIHRSGPVLWVNQDAERYCNENCGAITPGNNSNAVQTQKTSYLILDQGIIDTIVANGTDIQSQVDDAVAANPANNIYKADTIAELAEKIGLDPEALTATVEHYNEMCDKGDDEDFDKPADKMVALRNAPYYIFRQDLAFWTSVGGISTNRRMEAINEFGTPIPGLYAVGTDGCELYRETYTMNVPASCNANNVNSGRTAARNAAEYIG